MLQLSCPEYSMSNGSGYGYVEPQPKRYRNEDDKYDGDEVEKEEPLSEEDYWMVIDSFFEDKGLVRQQLESFNEFIENTMQEIVDERSRLTLDQHTQYTGRAGDETVGGGGTRERPKLTSVVAAARDHLWANLPRQGNNDRSRWDDQRHVPSGGQITKSHLFCTSIC
jgi:hypothetical protein